MRHSLVCLAFIAIAGALVHTASANDVQIAQQIAAQLRAHKSTQQLKGFHIGVKVEKGKVSMKGQVSDANQQALALDVARRVPGVKLVVNELHVAPAGGTVTASPMTMATTTLRQPASTLAVPAASVETTSEDESLQAAPAAQLILAPPQGVDLSPEAILATQAQLAVPETPAAVYAPTSQPTLQAPQVCGSCVVRSVQIPSRVPTLQVSPAAVSVPAPIAQRAPVVAQQQMPVRNRVLAAAPRAVTMGPPRPIARVASRPGSDVMMDPGMAVESPAPVPSYGPGAGGGVPAVMHDNPSMPPYAWPSYAAHPNYAAVTYPQQYSPTAWPYIGPFYPYPQVPLGWRKVTMEWDDGWWFLDFTAK